MQEIFSNVLRTLGELGTTYIFKILLAIIIVIVGLKLSKYLVKLLGKLPAYENLDKTVTSFLNGFIKTVLYATVFISAAMLLGVPTTSLITVLGSCGLAIGLALQGSLSNFAGGLMILIFKPFKVGDYIVSGSNEGIVREITILYTILDTYDNKTVSVPNGTLSNSSITDFSGKDTRRVDVKIGVSYASDTDKVKELLLGLAGKCDKALSDPAPFVGITEYSDSSIIFVLRVWTRTENYWDTLFFINDNLKKALDEGGISIPFPQVDVHMKND